ncbi:hypothetical protein KKD62_01355 [Patescibacteria group bacterium]|nr:hypothetical protein [Patescibacteria group bacterium]MBU1931653.1 hypothetical protein [Patescibacteria group bacterium]
MNEQFQNLKSTLYERKIRAEWLLEETSYRLLTSHREKLRDMKRFDNLVGGLMSLLDIDPTIVAKRLALDGEQTKVLFFLLQGFQEGMFVRRRPIRKSRCADERFLYGAYKVTQAPFISARERTMSESELTLLSAMAELSLQEVRIVACWNSTHNMPLTANFWASGGTKISGSLSFMFLPIKPESLDDLYIPGTLPLIRSQLGEVCLVAGGGDRVDFTSESDSMGQKKTTTNRFYYLGEFSFASRDFDSQRVHCWGHNSKYHSKTRPVAERLMAHQSRVRQTAAVKITPW